MENLYEVLEKSNKDLTTEQFSTYINKVLKHGKDILNESQKISLIDGSAKLSKILVKKETQRIAENEYAFLKEQGISVKNFSPKQLIEVSKIDEKLKQLGNYHISINVAGLVICFGDIIIKDDENDPGSVPGSEADNIYEAYIKEFKDLKNAKIIVKDFNRKFKWDGENFVPYEEPKINIDEAEKIVQDDMKEKCEKSYKESIEKHALSGNGAPAEYKADIKIKSDKSPEDTAKEVEQIIFKNSGIDFTNLYHEIEKAVKQEIEKYNKDMALSKTMGDSFLDDIIDEKSSNFRKQLKEIISDKLDDYGKVLTYKISLPSLGCSNMEEVKSRVENLNNFKKQLNPNVFCKIPEKEFIRLYNQAFDDNAETIHQIAIYNDIKL